MAGYGVIGGTGVLQGDQFTRAQQARASQNRQSIKQVGGAVKGALGGKGSVVEGVQAEPVMPEIPSMPLAASQSSPAGDQNFDTMRSYFSSRSE